MIPAVCVAEIVDLDDVLAADLVDRARLLEEPLDDFLVRRQLAMDDLERDLLADQRMLGEVDGTHPAGADLGQDPVVADRLPGAEQAPRS